MPQPKSTTQRQNLDTMKNPKKWRSRSYMADKERSAVLPPIDKATSDWWQARADSTPTQAQMDEMRRMYEDCAKGGGPAIHKI